MKKFRIFIALAATVAALASCNKNGGESQVVEGQPLRLVVGIDGAATKVTGVTSNDEATEAKVNSLQVFVFNGDSVDGYGTSTSKTATVTCTSGSRDIYAVVNAPSLAGVTSKTALLATVAQLENNISNFQMIGNKTEVLEYDGKVTIHVDRLAARVVIRGIKNGIEDAELKDKFKVLAVYLTNVTGDVNYGLTSGYDVTKWYNRRGYESGNSLGSFDYDAINEDVAAGASHSEAHFFYSLPNAYNPIVGLETGATGFTGRRARLVIKCEIDGKVYFYPILLPAMENNKSYEINLVNITRKGNEDNGKRDPNDPDDIDEEEPIESFDQEFEIIVNDWTVVLVNGDGNITI